MRKTLFLIAGLGTVLLMSISCGQPAATNNASANRPANNSSNVATASTAPVSHEAEVRRIMTDIAAALAKNDPAAAAKFYAEDYHLVTPQGVDQDKTARMADMTSGTTKFDSFAYENISVRSYGDTAVAIADVKATGKAAGQSVPSNIKATLVFQKTQDGMKVISGQATPVTVSASRPAGNTSVNSTSTITSNSNANAAANR